MAAPSRPKVILFDIGGVCVVSPFQAILDYELSLGIPPGWVNYSISKTAPTGFWHRLERGEISMDAAFFAGFNADLHDPARWRTFYRLQQEKDTQGLLSGEVPAVPQMDGELLFNTMMRYSRNPDPWMFPALQRLKASGAYILAALSNTVIFPRGHDLFREDYLDDKVLGIFDVFVSSAHVGLRKPDPQIYQLALAKVDEFARGRQGESGSRREGDAGARRPRWADGVAANEVLFLDDIGENLREARKQGFQTIKVHLGRGFEAVDELERITGLKLAGDHPRIPVKPKLDGAQNHGSNNKARL